MTNINYWPFYFYKNLTDKLPENIQNLLLSFEQNNLPCIFFLNKRVSE